MIFALILRLNNVFYEVQEYEYNYVNQDIRIEATIIEDEIFRSGFE